MNSEKLNSRHVRDYCLIVKKNDKFMNSCFFKMLSLFETQVGTKGLSISTPVTKKNVIYSMLYTDDDVKVYQVKKEMGKSTHNAKTDPIDIPIISPRGEMIMRIENPIYTEDSDLVPDGWAIIGGDYSDSSIIAKRLAVVYDTDVISVHRIRTPIYHFLTYEYYLAGSDRLYSSTTCSDLYKGFIGRFIVGVRKGVYT